MQLSAIEIMAIERFALNVTMPILIDINGTAQLLATGTLFEIEGRVFVITARHIFDDVPDLTTLAYPANPIKGGLHTLGSFEILKPKEEHIDVAAIELKSPETISNLRAGWKFLSLSNVASASPETADRAFFLSGYPASLAKISDSLVKGAFTTAYTQRIPVIPKEAKAPVSPDLDIFFDYGHDATSLSGNPVTTPELPGTSGASVWELKPVLDGVWTPEAATRVVGIQSSYIHSKYFRAKNWLAVAKVLEMADGQLANAVRHKLGET